MREMDDNYLSESDNFDTQLLFTKDNLRVVSMVCPRDATVTQLLRKKTITDELMANFALARWISSTSPRSSRKDSATRSSPSVMTLSCA